MVAQNLKHTLGVDGGSQLKAGLLRKLITCRPDQSLAGGHCARSIDGRRPAGPRRQTPGTGQASRCSLCKPWLHVPGFGRRTVPTDPSPLLTEGQLALTSIPRVLRTWGETYISPIACPS